jgi:flagellar hook protein FlgE
VQTGTASATVTALANAFNSASNSPVTATANGVVLNLTSKTPGAALTISSGWQSSFGRIGAFGGGVGSFAGVPIQPVFGSGSLEIAGSLESFSNPDSSTPFEDSGFFSVSVNGFSETAQVQDNGIIGGVPTGTASATVTALANAFNSASNSPVTATANGNVLTLTSKTPGAALTISSQWQSSVGRVGAFGGGVGSFVGIPIQP